MISNWSIPDIVQIFQYRLNYNAFFIWGSNSSDNEDY
jgi:hypothetical protein